MPKLQPGPVKNDIKKALAAKLLKHISLLITLNILRDITTGTPSSLKQQ